MSACAITICPPSSSFIHFDEHQFNRRSRAVDATYTGHDTWRTPGLSFGDFGFTQTRTYKSFCGRRYCVPSFVLNKKTFYLVLVSAIERRCYGSGQKAIAAVGHLPLPTRLKLAEDRLRQREPVLLKTLDTLCSEFVALRQSHADEARMLQLQSLIATLDSTIRINRNPTCIYGAILYQFWREGVRSNIIARDLSLSACAIRQILRRTGNTARRLGFTLEKTSDRFDRATQRRQARAERERLREEKRQACEARKVERARILEQRRVAREQHASEYAAARAARGRDRRDQYRAAGLCIRCGRPRAYGRLSCTLCLQYQKTVNDRRKARRSNSATG